MLNEEKVIMMTRMASYETGKGKEHLKIGTYFRGDYVAMSLIKAIFAITFSYVFIIIGYIMYNFDSIMENAFGLDIMATVKPFGKYYLISLIVYVVISYAVCNIKYIIAKNNIRKYKSNLKKLRKIEKLEDEEED